MEQERKRDNVDDGVNFRLKDVRLALGMSQAEFRGGLRVSGGHYAEIELGHRRVNDRLTSLVCATYGVRERFLTQGEEPMFYEAAGSKQDEVCRIFRELPPDFQDYLLKHARDMKALAAKNK
ncbi:MAG: helix-turn-helix transcriptional regulator [Spirochaetaceae bacterium]|jgi:transcriptional regulator with XRE-family HTH domain|nr:helix-turn-helix transcriptional regulator [Spirochaetaceae bacterium]